MNLLSVVCFVTVIVYASASAVGVGIVGAGTHGAAIQAPSAHTAIVGPDGSHIDAAAAGGAVVAPAAPGGAVVSGAAPAVVGVAPAVVGAGLAHGVVGALEDLDWGHDGQYVPSGFEHFYDDGSYRLEHHLEHD